MNLTLSVDKHISTIRKFEWYPKHLYRKHAPLIGSATAQQIIRKNSKAWRSFLRLKRLEKLRKLLPHIRKVSMPRYWKRKGGRGLRMVTRNNCYRVDDRYLYLPKGLKLRYWGSSSGMGKEEDLR